MEKNGRPQAFCVFATCRFAVKFIFIFSSHNNLVVNLIATADVGIDVSIVVPEIERLIVSHFILLFPVPNNCDSSAVFTFLSVAYKVGDYGYKVVVVFPINAKLTFGGNHIETNNSDTSAFYPSNPEGYKEGDKNYLPNVLAGSGFTEKLLPFIIPPLGQSLVVSPNTTAPESPS